MSFYWVKTRWFIKKCFSNFVWDINSNERRVYLTFDDGPTPEVTDWVLDVLKKYGIKATFFCIGNNIEKCPELFTRVVAEGHAIGNHTFNHLNGWKTDDLQYLVNVDAAYMSIMQRYPDFKDNMLFRPPYGKITTSQSAQLRAKGYRIIMWDVLSADFDPGITPEKCFHNVIKNTCDGSIIIFHDSFKAQNNLKHVLPKAIESLKKEGFTFDRIS